MKITGSIESWMLSLCYLVVTNGNVRATNNDKVGIMTTLGFRCQTGSTPSNHHPSCLNPAHSLTVCCSAWLAIEAANPYGTVNPTHYGNEMFGKGMKGTQFRHATCSISIKVTLNICISSHCLDIWGGIVSVSRTKRSWGVVGRGRRARTKRRYRGPRRTWGGDGETTRIPLSNW